MRTPTKILGFAVALALVFGVALGLGAAIGPSTAGAEKEASPPEGAGVVAAEAGYRLVPLTRTLPSTGGRFEFRIEGRKGDAVRRFTPLHDRPLHLVVVNRELTAFRHVHPALAEDGTWSVDLEALPPGSYRAIADFQVTGGPHLALGTDVSVAGDYRPGALPEPAATATVDGYDVAMRAERQDGGEVTFSLTVSRDGRPVSDLEPYLGARGHLVAIRTGDLAYAHVHPLADGDGGGDLSDKAPADGTVRFDATLDATGRYGLFLDFQHGGVVHTARFTFDQGVITGAPKKMEH
jgi:hypothetical protein